MIKYIKRKILDMSLRWKFFIFTILISFIPVAFIGIFSYKISQEYLKESVIKSVIMKSETVNAKLEKYLSDIDESSIILMSNSNVQKFLSLHEVQNRYVYENAIKNIFSSLIYSKNNIQSIALYDSKGNIRVYEASLNENWNLRKKASENIESTNIFPDVKKLLGKRIWTRLYKDTHEISMIRVVNETGGQNQIGTLVINMNEEIIQEAIQNIASAEGGSLVISEQSGNIVYSSTEIDTIPNDMKTQLGASGYKTISINNIKYLYIYYVSNFCGWRMNTLIPLNSLFSKVASIAELTIIIIAICIILVVAFTMLITNFLAKPIKKLSKLMGRVEQGDLEIRFVNYYNDEIGQLGQNFNSMIEKTKLLLDENIEKQKRLRIQELKALQAQINPHFLYNTIDTINWMAQSINADEISEISIALANYYRLSLSKGAETIKISDEVNQVKNYLKIQKIRYDKYLNYEIDVSEEILDLYICKLTLQPIIENAIYHGIKNKEDSSGIIKLMGRYDEDHVIFEVWDNGNGMSREKLESVRESINKVRVEGFGISNTNERIKLFFGDEYGIEIDSVENIYTKVTVTIPATKFID